MSIFDSLSNAYNSIKNVVVNASYYSAEKTSNLFGLTPIKKTDTAKQVATKAVKNVVAEGATALAVTGVGAIPVSAATIIGGSAVAIGGTGYILSTEKPLNTLKEVANSPVQLSNAIFDLGNTAGSFSLEKSKEENFGLAKDYVTEHPVATAIIGAGALYAGGKATSSALTYFNTQAVKENTKASDSNINQGSFTPVEKSNGHDEDIAETNAEANIKIAKIQAESQLAIAKEQTKQLEYQAKQTAQQQAISTPTTPSVVPVTKKKKTTKKKTKKKSVTKKKTKKASKSKKKR